MLQQWAPRASMRKPTSSTRRLRPPPTHPLRHRRAPTMPYARRCRPPSPVLYLVAMSYPALCASSPSFVQCHLLHAAELRVTGKLHIATEIHAQTLRPETRVLLSSTHCCCAPPILCVVTGSKGNRAATGRLNAGVCPNVRVLVVAFRNCQLIQRRIEQTLW